jgi:GNAT superfamily N-acetyltransferase
MAGSNTLIRSAKVKDAPALAELAGQLGYPTTPAQAAVRLAYLLSKPDHEVFVAERGPGEIIGWIHVFKLTLLESPPTAEIGGLVVDQRLRGSGSGKALVQAARRWAMRQGLQTLWVRSNTIREKAHKFYEGEGFSRIKTQVFFSTDLVPPEKVDRPIKYQREETMTR